jgi:hypothetical protein
MKKAARSALSMYPRRITRSMSMTVSSRTRPARRESTTTVDLGLRATELTNPMFVNQLISLPVWRG